jgi:hypothetical protein
MRAARGALSLLVLAIVVAQEDVTSLSDEEMANLQAHGMDAGELEAAAHAESVANVRGHTVNDESRNVLHALEQVETPTPLPTVNPSTAASFPSAPPTTAVPSTTTAVPTTTEAPAHTADPTQPAASAVPVTTTSSAWFAEPPTTAAAEAQVPEIAQAQTVYDPLPAVSDDTNTTCPLLPPLTAGHRSMTWSKYCEDALEMDSTWYCEHDCACVGLVKGSPTCQCETCAWTPALMASFGLAIFLFVSMCVCSCMDNPWERIRSCVHHCMCPCRTVYASWVCCPCRALFKWISDCFCCCSDDDSHSKHEGDQLAFDNSRDTSSTYESSFTPHFPTYAHTVTPHAEVPTPMPVSPDAHRHTVSL